MIDRRLAMMLLLLAAVPGGAAAQSDPVTDGTRAGEAGRARDFVIVCTSTKAKESFRHQGLPIVDMRISGPRGDIAMKAAEAKRLYQSLDVSADLTAWHLTVLAHPQTFGAIQQLAIRGAAGGVVAADTFVQGPPVRGTVDALATFTSGAAQVIASTGDFQIVAVTNAGERSCDVDAKARAKLGF